MFHRPKKTFDRSEPDDVQQSGAVSPIRLRDGEDWQEFLRRSRSKRVLVFKHSTRCGVSDAVLRDFEEFASGNASLACGVVDVVEDRRLSDAIALEMGVQHESPQVIMIEDSRAVWHASHWSITAAQLQQALGS